MMKEKKMETQEPVIARKLLRTKLMAVSMGSVRCCTSARTANRMTVAC